MAKETYASWLTKDQAMEVIGVGRRTLEQLAKDGQLEVGKRKVPGGLWNAVYNPEDVKRVAHERHPSKPFVLPVGSVVPANGNGNYELVPTAPLELAGPALTFAQALRDVVRHPAGKWMLSVKEAAEQSGWTETYIRRAIADGRLPAVKDRGWRIRRPDLEKL